MLADHEDIIVGDTVYYICYENLMLGIIKCVVDTISHDNFWLIDDHKRTVVVSKYDTGLSANFDALYDDAIMYLHESRNKISTDYLKLLRAKDAFI